jgi:regulator of sirC expression with transglutaminase-like and TPR domain
MVEMGFDDLRESSTLVASANRYLSEVKVWQAISVLSRALELDPQYGDLLRARGHAYYDLAQSDLALADYRAFETLAGEGADALVAERILRIETASR